MMATSCPSRRDILSRESTRESHSGTLQVFSLPRLQMLPTPPAHLSSKDRRLFYQYGIGPSRPVKVPIIHHAFEYHARTQPQAIAVEHTLFNDSITYGQLNLRADRLAQTLRAGNIVPGARVCILGRRSVALVIAIIAVLKSGGQYVPLDALTITDETLQFVIGDSSPRVILVMEEFRHRISTCDVPVISLESVIHSDEQSNPYPTKVEDLSSPTDGAYCIYTSGTTGSIVHFFKSL